jgi:hypothetical protein
MLAPTEKFCVYCCCYTLCCCCRDSDTEGRRQRLGSRSKWRTTKRTRKLAVSVFSVVCLCGAVFTVRQMSLSQADAAHGGGSSSTTANDTAQKWPLQKWSPLITATRLAETQPDWVLKPLTAVPEKVAISDIPYCSAPLHGAPPDATKVSVCAALCTEVSSASS